MDLDRAAQLSFKDASQKGYLYDLLARVAQQSFPLLQKAQNSPIILRVKEIDTPVACFDVDGTLHNTYEFIVQAFEKTLEQHNLEKRTRKEISATAGLRLADCYRILAPGSKMTDKLCQTHRDFEANNPQLIVPFTDTLSVLEQLRNVGIKIAAVTARKRASALVNMERTGVLGMMHTVVTSDDVTNPKPHPEAILLALSQLNSKPYRATMAGDSRFDIEAGRSARVKATIGAAYGFESFETVKSKPDYVVDNIAAMLPIILTRLGMIIDCEV